MLLSNEDIQALGFVTRGLYVGPLSLDATARLLQQLALSRRAPTPSNPHAAPLGEPVFGRLVIVAQGNGFNVVEIVSQIVS